MSISQIESNVERIQTRIDMIRQESRTLSFRIERMLEQRKQLSQEKKNLKDLSTAEQTEEVEDWEYTQAVSSVVTQDLRLGGGSLSQVRYGTRRSF